MKRFSLLFEYYRKYRKSLIIGLVFLLMVDGCQIVIPWFVRKAINILASGGEADIEIIRIGLYILLLAIGIGVTRFAWRYFIIGISRKIETDLRNRFYIHLQKLSFPYFDKTSVGDLMAHATNDIEAVRMMCGMALVAFTDSAILSLASLIMMFSISSSLTAYVLIPLPIVTVTVLIFGPVMHRKFRDVQEGFSELTEKAQETFAGIKVIKSFVQEDAEDENFRKINASYFDKNMSLVKVWGILHPVIWIVGSLCSVIILYFGGGKVIDGRISMGDFVAFNSYLGILVWPMIAIGWVVNLYQRGKASLGRLAEIFNTQPEIQDAPGAVAKKLHGHIELRNLSFAYDSQPTIKNINLILRPGEWLAIMGATGSSKTTLVNLISRFYDPEPNSIFIDGIDVRKWSLQSLRSQIAVVPQQTFLFSDKIANNVRFGLDLSDDSIRNCIELAQLDKDLAMFPEGLETVVGERGVTLSGGQKQRVAIARALAANAPMLILDDALSAVDSETEDAIIQGLLKHCRAKTVIIISHRVAFARHADKIIFLADGAISEEGRHEDLLAKKGRYFQIHEHQRLIEEIDKENAPIEPGKRAMISDVS